MDGILSRYPKAGGGNEMILTPLKGGFNMILDTVSIAGFYMVEFSVIISKSITGLTPEISGGCKPSAGLIC